jgi:AcrR family transcriptional regulator
MEQVRPIRSVLNRIAEHVRSRESMSKQKKVEDRRIQRTRALLQNALVSLMIEKAYESITVQEIIDRANVGRATFYAHFADKESLLTSRLEDLRAALLRHQREALSASGNGIRTFSFSRAMLEHASDSLTLWRGIAGKESGTFVMARIQDMLAELVRNDVAALGLTRKSPDREALVQHLAGGFIALMVWWLNEGKQLSVEEIDGRFTRLALHGLAAFLPTAQVRRVR